MAGLSFYFKILLPVVIAWFSLTTEATKIPSASANFTREAKQLVFLYPNPVVEKIPNEYADVGYQQQPRRSYAPPTTGQSSADERFFGLPVQGLSSLLTGRPLCPSCPTCPVCPSCQTCQTCPTCAATCPATTNPASPFTLTIAATSCSAGIAGANFFGSCTRTFAAPSGAFTVSFPAAAPAAANGLTVPTAFVNIIPVCPNNRVTVTCGTVPAGWLVSTQNGQVIPPGAGGSVTESGSMQLIINQGAPAGGLGSVPCTWTSSP